MSKILKLNFTSVECSNPTPLKRGPLKMPDGVFHEGGDLIMFGEDKTHVHCVTSNTGDVYSVFKSPDPNHLYQHLLKLNTNQERK